MHSNILSCIFTRNNSFPSLLETCDWSTRTTSVYLLCTVYRVYHTIPPIMCIVVIKYCPSFNYSCSHMTKDYICSYSKISTNISVKKKLEYISFLFMRFILMLTVQLFLFISFIVLISFVFGYLTIKVFIVEFISPQTISTQLDKIFFFFCKLNVHIYVYIYYKTHEAYEPK